MTLQIENSLNQDLVLLYNYNDSLYKQNLEALEFITLDNNFPITDRLDTIFNYFKIFRDSVSSHINFQFSKDWHTIKKGGTLIKKINIRPEHFKYSSVNKPKDWITVETDIFSLKTPQDWFFEEEWGIDSRVGNIFSKDTTKMLYYDDIAFGAISELTNTSDKDYHVIQIRNENFYGEVVFSDIHKNYYQVFLYDQFWLRYKNNRIPNDNQRNELIHILMSVRMSQSGRNHRTFLKLKPMFERRLEKFNKIF